METYSFKCRGCGEPLKGDASKIGKVGRCPICGERTRFELPDDDSDLVIDVDEEPISARLRKRRLGSYIATAVFLLLVGAGVWYVMEIPAEPVPNAPKFIPKNPPPQIWNENASILILVSAIVLAIVVGLLIKGFPSEERFICSNPNCGYSGTAKAVARGSCLISLLLWIVPFVAFEFLGGLLAGLFLILAFGYTVFCRGYRYYCPRCRMQLPKYW